MKCVRENAKQELASLVHSIGKDVSSWAGWYCLHVSVSAPKRNYDTKTLHHEICAMLERYFIDGSGIAFFIDETDIYFFCKDAVKGLMNDIGHQVTHHIKDRTGADAYGSYWLIKDDGAEEGPKNQQLQNSSFTKVLLVEDDPVTRWMVRTALKGQCTLLTASTAGGAIESYHKCKPDLVFLDINLPDKNGQDVLRDIFNADPRANIVVFSSQNNIETMIEMLETGACGFVSKPFTRQRLLTYVKRLAV